MIIKRILYINTNLNCEPIDLKYQYLRNLYAEKCISSLMSL